MELFKFIDLTGVKNDELLDETLFLFTLLLLLLLSSSFLFLVEVGVPTLFLVFLFFDLTYDFVHTM